MTYGVHTFTRRDFVWLGSSSAIAGLGLVEFCRAAEPPPAAPPKGLRVFTCGHSFHLFVYPMLQDFALAAGIKDHGMVGLSRIGGSRVLQHWDVPDEMNEAKKALREGKVDVLTLSPIWLPDPGIENFAKLAFEHNPNVRIMVQEFWLPNDAYEPIYPLQTRKGVDHDATDLTELGKENDAYCHDIEEHVSSLNKALGKEVVFVVPVGEASVALRKKIVAGEAPGLKVQWDLFRDAWGHAKVPLMVLAGYCNFAVIYGISPVGLRAPRVMTADPTLSDADREKLNRLLQEIAWETVRKHPHTGLNGSDR